MPKQWAKVYRNAPMSERLADLYRRNKGALAMFWPLKALSDDLGRYPANPRKFAHEVGGLCNISAKTAGKMIADMAATGVIRLYEVEGEEYLEIADYHSHEDPRWYYVGEVKWPAPRGWAPPETLVAFLRENSDGKQNVTAKRYGILRGISAECDALIDELDGNDSTNDTSTTVEL